MALPATPSLSPPSADLAHDYSQPPHRLKRRHSDIDDSNDEDPAPTDTRSSIAAGLKKLRLAPRSTAPPPTTTTNTSSSHALPHSSAFPTSHPAYLLPQQPSSLPSPLHLTPAQSSVPGRGPLSPFLSPTHPLIDRNCVNTPPPAALAPASASSSRASTWTDSMILDNPAINFDTPNRVVINDLDAELAEIDAEEEQLRRREQDRLFSLPGDVDKQVSAIPTDVLRHATTTTPASAGAPEPSNSQALILYKEPPSFGLPPTEIECEAEAKQKVRMAKQRIRERQKEAREPEPQSIQQPPSPPLPWARFEPVMAGDINESLTDQCPVNQWQVHDEDAMDIE